MDTHEISQNCGFYFQDHFHLHKEIIANRNFELLDKLLFNQTIISSNLDVIPKNPIIGGLYLLADKITENLWQGHEKKIACYVKKDDWHFIKPHQGMLFFLLEEKKFLVFHQNNWLTFNITNVDR